MATANKSTTTTRKTSAAKKVEAKIETVTEKVPQVVDEYVGKLEGKTVQELLNLRADALVEEDSIKRGLVLLRQRSANLASTAETAVEEEIIRVKNQLGESIDRLRAIDKKLENEYLDIYGTKRY